MAVVRRTSLRWSLVVLLALVITACGGSSDSEAATAAADSSGSSSDADGLVAETADGGQLAFNDLQGKPALVWFWAPW